MLQKLITFLLWNTNWMIDSKVEEIEIKEEMEEEEGEVILGEKEIEDQEERDMIDLEETMKKDPLVDMMIEDIKVEMKGEIIETMIGEMRENLKEEMIETMIETMIEEMIGTMIEETIKLRPTLEMKIETTIEETTKRLMRGNMITEGTSPMSIKITTGTMIEETMIGLSIKGIDNTNRREKKIEKEEHPLNGAKLRRLAPEKTD